MSARIPYLDATDVDALLTPTAAVDALRLALAEGFRPKTDHARIFERLQASEFLLMPTETATSTGIKLLTIASQIPSVGLARIQGLYVLFDSATLTPRALIDGPALTDIRTSAVSIAAIKDALERDRDTLDVVVYGAGPQARAHVRTTRAVLKGTLAVGTVTSVVRSPLARPTSRISRPAPPRPRPRRDRRDSCYARRPRRPRSSTTRSWSLSVNIRRTRGSFPAPCSAGRM